MAIEHPSQGMGCGKLLEYVCDPQLLIYHTSRYKADSSYIQFEILWQIHEPRDAFKTVLTNTSQKISCSKFCGKNPLTHVLPYVTQKLFLLN